MKTKYITIISIIIFTINTSSVYALAPISGVVDRHKLFRSKWEIVQDDNFSHPNHLVKDDKNRLWLVDGHCLKMSLDFGKTWNVVFVGGWLLSVYYDKKNSSLWVVSYGGHEIWYSENPTEVNSWKQFPVSEEIGSLNNPTSVMIDKDNNLLVCDFGNHRILKTSDMGKTWEVFLEIESPTCVMIDSKNWIWVTTNSGTSLIVRLCHN